MTQNSPQTDVQYEVQGDSEKQMLERMCQQKKAAQVAEACACLGANQGFLGGVVHASAGNSTSRQLRHRNTHQEDAGLLLQSLDPIVDAETINGCQRTTFRTQSLMLKQSVHIVKHWRQSRRLCRRVRMLKQLTSKRVSVNPLSSWGKSKPGA